MSNLGEALWQRAFEQGLEQARETQRLTSIRNLMENAQLTSTQAMDALKIPEAEQNKYLAMLNA